MKDILYIKWLISLMAGMLISGCAIEIDQPQDGLVLQLNIPNSSEVVTRANTTPASPDELRIHNGYFFVFNSDGDYEKSYVIDHVDVLADSNGSTNPRISIPKATTIASGKKIVLFLNQTPIDTDFDNFTFSTIVGKFALNGEGLIDNATTPIIPMYGEVLNWNSTLSNNNIEVIRALAKIQVKLGTSFTKEGVSASYFTTENVTYKLYNYAIRGKINPLAANLNYSSNNATPTLVANDDDITNAVTLQSTAQNFIGASYIYEFPYSTNLVGEAERLIDSKNFNPHRFAIILKVKQGSSSEYRYHRLDMYHQLNKDYLDIKRNNHYQLIINSVNSTGYITASEALKSPASNIEFEIIIEGGDFSVSNAHYAIVLSEQGESSYDNYISTSASTTITLQAKCVLPHEFTATSSYNVEIINTDGNLTVTKPNVELSSEFKNIDFIVNGTGTADITLEIKYGNLTYSKIYNVQHLSGNCYAYNNLFLSKEIQNDATWSGPTPSGVTISGNGKSFSISENTTPVSWKLWNEIQKGYEISEQAIADAIPEFNARIIEGTITGSSTVTKVFIQQAPPVYIGRFGSPIIDETGEGYTRKRAIMAAMDDGNSQFATENTIQYKTLEYNNGFLITDDIRRGTTISSSATTATAVMICYRKNGSTSDRDPVTWYLPARSQLMGIYANIDEDNTFKGTEYWSSSEQNNADACHTNMSTGLTLGTKTKAQLYSLRCIRDLE